MNSLPNRFKSTPIQRFPKLGSAKRVEDAIFWKHLQFPITFQESGPISRVDVSVQSPHFIAVTGTTKIQLYEPESNEVVKTFTKFKDGCYGGRLRKDAKLLCAGSGQDGGVKLFQIDSKTQLRHFTGHKMPTRRVDFLSDLKTVVTFSDDKTLKLWDIGGEQMISSYEQHEDYIRAGCTSFSSADLFVSGSYDHTVRVWDRRKSQSISMLQHGSPIEDVLLLPNDAILVTAGGHDIKVWDLIAGGKLLARMSPHNKTVTSLGLVSHNKRVMSASLDSHVKFHDLTSFKTVHSVKFQSPILSAAVAPDDSFIATGTVDGLVQFMHRKPPAKLTDDQKRENALKDSSVLPYLKYIQYTPKSGDIVVKRERKPKENRHDTHLRKFEHTKALDQVLKPFVQGKNPEITYSVIKELQRRNALTTAMAGRDAKGLAPLVSYLNRHINNIKFNELLIDVASELLDLYCESIVNKPEMHKLFSSLKRIVEREANTVHHLMMLEGSIDMVLTASRAHEEPELRSEEIQMKQNRQADQKINSNMNLAIDRLLMT